MPKLVWFNGTQYTQVIKEKGKLELTPVNNEEQQRMIKKWTKNKIHQFERTGAINFITAIHIRNKTYAVLSDYGREQCEETLDITNIADYGLAICSQNDKYDRDLGDVIAACRLFHIPIPDFIYRK